MNTRQNVLKPQRQKSKSIWLKSSQLCTTLSMESNCTTYLYSIPHTVDVLFLQQRIWMSRILWRTSVHVLPMSVLQLNLEMGINEKKVLEICLRADFRCGLFCCLTSFSIYIYIWFALSIFKIQRVHRKRCVRISWREWFYCMKFTLECTAFGFSCLLHWHLHKMH